MPRDNIEPCAPEVTFKFDAGMSDAEVQEDIDRLMALGRNHNILFEKLREVDAEPGSQSAKETEALRLLMAFMSACGAPDLVNSLFGPLLRKLINDLVRDNTKRSDGVRAKPKEYTLPVALERTYLALAAEGLMRFRTEDETETWLRLELHKHGIKVATKTIMEWRHEITERKAKRQAGVPEDALLDITVETFKIYQPTCAQVQSQAESERLASQFLDAAKFEHEQNHIASA